jgi:uncharacterized protein involved in response to NO
VLGRLAVTGSAWIGWLAAAVIDLSFVLLVTMAAAREIVVGRNWRNLKVLIPLGMLLVGNATFHIEVHLQGVADYGVRLGVAASILLVMVIGGRIVPSFTRNWLVKENPGRIPMSFDRFDVIAVVCAGASLAAWTAAPKSAATGTALIASGVLQAIRLARWAGDRTWRDRLVLILHVAYAFVPLGFVVVGLAALDVLPAAAGIHAWTAGAIGTMTLAVMSRASLGHTGRALVATGPVQAVYALVVLSALTRVCAAIRPGGSAILLLASGLAWSAAFLGFAVAYWSVFTRPRLGK